MIRTKRTRKTDIDRIRAWIGENPEKAWASLINRGLEPLTIERIISGKQAGVPRPTTRRLFALASGLPEDILFPFVDASEEKAS